MRTIDEFDEPPTTFQLLRKIKISSEHRILFFLLQIRSEAFLFPNLEKEKESNLNILIIGGGDLFVANYLLKRENIEKITLCELDEGVTKIVRRNFNMG